MKISLVTLCSGIEAQGSALRRLCRDYPNMEWELLAWSEIDKDAIKAHNAIFPEYADRNLGDMTTADYSKITEMVDCLFYSTPCQSVSVAGQNKGMEEGSDAASALIWHTRRAIETLKPKVCILENVKGMIMGKNVKEFHKWQHVMESYGYTNFAKVLNSKDFGVPQNRERLFMVSIRDCTQSYHFPEPFKLEKRIKDILEPYGTVDESFYFSAKQLSGMFKYCAKKKDEGCGFQTQFTDENGIASCVTTRYGASYTDAYLKEPALQQRLSLYGNNAQAGRVYDVEGIAPCLDTCCGGNRMPKILTSVRSEEMKELRKKGIERFSGRVRVPREDGISNTITTVTKDNMLMEPAIIQRTHGFNDGGEFSESAPTVTTSSWEHNNFCKEPMYARLCETLERADLKNKDSVISDEYNKVIYDDVAPTITTRVDASGNIRLIEKWPSILENLPDHTVLKDEDGKGYLLQDGCLWRVRKLTGLEVMRLMDVADDDYFKMKDAGISKTAIYSLAGNSIVINVLYHIFRKLWIDTGNESAQKSLFDF